MREPVLGNALKRRASPYTRGFLDKTGAISIYDEGTLLGAFAKSVEHAVSPLTSADQGETIFDGATQTRIVGRALVEFERILEQTRMSPEMRSTAEIVEQVLPIVQKEHEFMRDKEVRQLAKALLEIARIDDPLVSSHEMIKENARLRAAFLTNWPVLSSRSVTELVGHRAKNASATPSRWKNRNVVFSVTTTDGHLFPAFQFEKGEPHPSVAMVLEKLPKTMTDWSIAFWFTSPNPYLEGKLPVEMLHCPDLLLEAAAYEAEALVG